MQNHYISIWSVAVLALLKAFFPLHPFYKGLSSLSLFYSRLTIICSTKGTKGQILQGSVRVSPAQLSLMIGLDSLEEQKQSPQCVMTLRCLTENKYHILHLLTIFGWKAHCDSKQFQDFFLHKVTITMSLSNTEGLECVKWAMIPVHV